MGCGGLADSGVSSLFFLPLKHVVCRGGLFLNLSGFSLHRVGNQRRKNLPKTGTFGALEGADGMQTTQMAKTVSWEYGKPKSQHFPIG